jgi:hypothetical protein
MQGTPSHQLFEYARQRSRQYVVRVMQRKPLNQRKENIEPVMAVLPHQGD